MDELSARLDRFASTNGIKGKGPLCVMLVVTRQARSMQPPFSPTDFLVSKGGQVAGLGRSAVQAVLHDYGVTRVLAEEGGRTSRGSIQRMQAYIEFLNGLHKDGLLDFTAIEQWWVNRVHEYFASQPLKLRVDRAKSLRSIVAELIDAAFARQRECPGTMVAGAIMQHLVGAKLEIALPDAPFEHHGFSVADRPSDRKGDFLIGDTAIHVTTAPTEALIRKCADNLAASLQPIIITTQSGVGGASALAKNADIADRIEILEIEQFVAANILEKSQFKQTERPVTVQKLVDVYNRIINDCETDPSLHIEVG